MNKATKSLAISQKTKQIVHERDSGCCIFCGRPVSETYSNAHFIPRSKMGLGIEQNILTACMECHFKLDQTMMRKDMLEHARKHLERHYPKFNDKERVYRK